MVGGRIELAELLLAAAYIELARVVGNEFVDRRDRSQLRRGQPAQC